MIRNYKMGNQDGHLVATRFSRTIQGLRDVMLAALLIVACTGANRVLAESPYQAVCDDPVHFPEYHRLDYLLGQWVIYADGMHFADATLARPQGGCALVETWRGLPSETFANRPSVSNALIAYDSETKRWQYTWVAGVIGLVLQFTAPPDKDLVWTRSETSAEGTVKQQRVSFTRVSDVELHERGVASVDAGATWTTEYDLTWRRKSKRALP
jgi:hypothetical protein